MNSLIVKSATIVVGILALVVGFWLAVSQQNESLTISEDVGIVYPKAREIGGFNLIDYDNQPITADHLKGKWWLVYFGFTFCPDACPVALGDMKKVKAMLTEEAAENLGFAFVSVDPERDSPARLKEYVSYFDPEFIAMTGDSAALEDLASKVGVVFIVPKNPEDENYVVDHSTFMLLWNPQVNLKAILKAPHKPDQVVNAIQRIMNASKSS